MPSRTRPLGASSLWTWQLNLCSIHSWRQMYRKLLPSHQRQIQVSPFNSTILINFIN